MRITTTIKPTYLVLSAFLITWLLVGCGQKGDLYQPKQQTLLTIAPNHD